MSYSHFDFLLLNATRRMGSVLSVATLLGVKPKQVYGWLADVEQPSDAVRAEVVRRLSSALSLA
jgi:hypothetical protein